MRLRLFRGITVQPGEAERTTRGIRAHGLRAAAGRWILPVPVPRDQAEEEAAVERRRTGSEEHDEVDLSVCACGDETGAALYAWVRNRGGAKTTPLLIEFQADLSRVAVDGRDLLYTVFGNGDPEIAPGVLRQIYGEGVLPYLEAAWKIEDVHLRMAECDRAVLDPGVVAAHHANRLVMQGRYGTVFSSAFQVRLPVLPSDITRVWVPEKHSPQAAPEVLLDQLLLPH